MSAPILATKLYVPPLRPNLVPRPRLIEGLNDGLQRKLTLISAPAGFGKTTLLSEWVAGCGRAAAWLSLDAGDSDPVRFLTYLVAALQTIAADIDEGMLRWLSSPQPPSIESILTALLNDIAAIPHDFVLVLDDYHTIDAEAADHALAFLLEHQPPQMHLIIATREDPQLPLARFRAGGQLTELRAADLRFDPSEAAGFLNQVMGLNLSTQDIAALDSRTEGWIAGLQLAAISMRGHADAAGFIHSFTGNNRFVMDYLMEEVLQRQPERIQAFLLRTSILDRLCAPLCDAVLSDPSAPGRETIEYLEQANLFIVHLDNERHWYRYHHLFAEFLRQRLQQSAAPSAGNEGKGVAKIHIQASQWYEDNGLELEAFHHAAAAGDVERCLRLIDAKGMPLHFRGAVTAIIDWLESLPKTVLDARPWLWMKYASFLLVAGRTTGVEEMLQAAEAAMQGAEPDEGTRNLIGRIAGGRAMLALTRYQTETMIAESLRALEYLDQGSVPFRTTAMWTLGYAHQLRGDRTAAFRVYTEALSISQSSGNIFFTILLTIGQGLVQELENQLPVAAETFRRVLQMSGDLPLPIVSEAHLGLARIFYEWNDLDAAERHGQQSLQLAHHYDRVIDRFVISEVFLARLKLARGDAAGAAAILSQADQSVRQHNWVHRIPEVAAARVLTLLHQGDAAAAARLAEKSGLPLSRARVHLAQGDPAAAMAVLEPFRRQVEAKGWQDERLKAMVLQAVASHAQGEKDKGADLLGDALALAEPGGFIRIFVDEGVPVAALLRKMNASCKGRTPGQKEYIRKLLAAFAKEKDVDPELLGPQPLVEPLSKRELEILQLVARGLSNREIGKRLYLELTTVKGHNQKIFAKLDVQRRTEAVARARELGLI